MILNSTPDEDEKLIAELFPVNINKFPYIVNGERIRSGCIEYNRIYYQQNKNKIKFNYDLNKKLISEKNKIYRKLNKKESNEKSKTYYELNKEKILKRNRENYAKNPEPKKLKERERRYKKSKNSTISVNIETSKLLENPGKNNPVEKTITVNF
jgi:hypothetical protein